jgi:L-ribulose-5-phosphate 4-epimerase
MTYTDHIGQLRKDLVTCTRLLVFCNVLDYSGHLSARIPGTDTIVIQPRDMSRAALSADDLLVVNLDGDVVQGDVPPPAETAIHTAVYRARPDVSLVCHGHPTLSTTFSMTDRPLLPMRHFAFKFPNGLPTHPDPTLIRTREQGDAVAETLGNNGACLLRSHGTVVVATRIEELFMDCLDIEENARTLLYATQLGGEVLPLRPDEIELISKSYGGLGHRPRKLWEHYVHQGRAAGVL